MKADPTLVAGARSVAQAMKPLDMSKYYQAQAEMQGNFYDTIKTIFDKKQLESEAIMARINDPIEKILTNIANDGTEGSEKQYDAASTMLEGWKEEYRAAVNSGDKKAQHKILGKLNNMSTQNTQIETDLMTLGQLITNDEVNATATDPSTFAALEKLIDFENNNPDVTYSYDERGNLTYVVDTGNTEYGDNGFVTVKASDIKKLVIPFAHEAETKYGEILQNSKTLGNTKGGKFDFENTKYLLSRTVFNSEQAFADLVTRKFGGNKESFRDALIKDPKLQEILMGLDSSYDANKSGGIGDELVQNTDGTFVNDANATAIIDALTNINAKGKDGKSIFDFKVAKELASHWFATHNEAAFNEYGGGRGTGAGAVTDTGTDIPTFKAGAWSKMKTTSGEKSVEGSVINQALSDLENPKEGVTVVGWDGINYKYENGQWNDLTNGGVVDKLQISKNLGLYGHGYRPASTGPSTTGTNPFGGATAGTAPTAFRDAVDQGEEDTVTYLEGLKIPGLTVEDWTGDRVKIKIGDKSKTFVVDPYWGKTTKRANQIWKWLYDNYTVTGTSRAT